MTTTATGTLVYDDEAISCALELPGDEGRLRYRVVGSVHVWRSKKGALCARITVGSTDYLDPDAMLAFERG